MRRQPESAKGAQAARASKKKARGSPRQPTGSKSSFLQGGLARGAPGQIGGGVRNRIGTANFGDFLRFSPPCAWRSSAAAEDRPVDLNCDPNLASSGPAGRPQRACGSLPLGPKTLLFLSVASRGRFRRLGGAWWLLREASLGIMHTDKQHRHKHGKQSQKRPA